MRIRMVAVVLLASAVAAAVVGYVLPAGASGNPAAPIAGGPGLGQAGFPQLKHIFVIMMENTSYSDLLNPSNANTTFIQSIANTYGLETNYSGVTHVSLPNYIAATSGSNWGSNSDDVAQAPLFDHTNLADQLDGANVSWKAYMEDLPSAGDTVAQTPDGLYVRKHDPFLMYPDIYNDPARANNVVPLTQLTTDLSTNKVPQFVWITPNNCNNMHGGAPSCPFPDTPTDQFQTALYQDGDTFLKTWVNAIMHSKAWTGNSAIFVTWDESSFADDAPFGPNDTSGCCDAPRLPATPPDPTSGGGGDLAGGSVYGGGHVPMIVISRNGPRGVTDNTATNHYSLLQTIEQNWNLPYLGNASDTLNVHSLAPLLTH